MLRAKMLLLISIILLISGCSQEPKPTIVYLPQKCIIPQVEKPIIDNTKYTSYNDIIAKTLKNYVGMKEYSEKLLEAQKICK